MSRLALWSWGAFGALLFVVSLVVQARAHDAGGWQYDEWCCDNRDCRPYLGQVREEPDGYHLEDGTVVPYDFPNMKEAPDGRFHICMYPVDTVRCFYRPGRSF